MFDERSARRVGFAAGAWVALRYGRRWALPPFGPRDRARYRMIRGLPGRHDRLYSELVLALDLLRRNYTIQPAHLPEILPCDHDGSALAEVCQALRDLADPARVRADRIYASAN